MLMAGTAPAAAAMDSDDAYVDSVCRQFDLNEVVVTGTRTPKFLKDTAAFTVAGKLHLFSLGLQLQKFGVISCVGI